MRFASLDIVKKAYKCGYAIPAFNINNTEWMHCALTASILENSPLILASSDRMADFLGGFSHIRRTLESYCDAMEADIPVVLHLDHGQSVERCIQAIDSGYSSVMIDGSRCQIDQNIEMTSRVAKYAAKYGVSVEAEVGCVGGSEDGINSGIAYADTKDCVRLVSETGVDALAAALGSVHGIYVGEPKLSFERMEELISLIDIPLVLHGASGIPKQQIDRCIQLGHSKININTECNQIWMNALAYAMKEKPDSHEPRDILEPAREKLTAFMRSKIIEFGSANRR